MFETQWATDHNNNNNNRRPKQRGFFHISLYVCWLMLTRRSRRRVEWSTRSTRKAHTHMHIRTQTRTHARTMGTHIACVCIRSLYACGAFAICWDNSLNAKLYSTHSIAYTYRIDRTAKTTSKHNTHRNIFKQSSCFSSKIKIKNLVVMLLLGFCICMLYRHHWT